MTSAPLRPTRSTVLLQALTLALCFLYLETSKAMRSSQWGGVEGDAWLGLLAGFVLYAMAFIALGGIVGWLLLRLPFFGAHRSLAVALAGILPGCGVWALLSAFREFAPTADDGLVLVMVCGVALWPILVWRWPPRKSQALLVISVLSAHIALHACGVQFLYAPERARMLTLLPVCWALLVLTSGFPPWRRPRSAVFSRTLHAAASLTLPLLAALYLTHASRPADRADKPNILFIVSDTLRADQLSLYGGPVATPHIDALARRGVHFQQSYSLAPWTLPSMTALFTSQYPTGLTPDADSGTWQAQLYEYDAVSPGGSLAERLRKEGYATGAFTANAFLPSIPGMLDGFDEHASSHPILLLRQGPLAFLPFLQDAIAGLFPALDTLSPHDTTLDMTRYAKAFMGRHRDRPFHLWIHYIDPHAPYAPPERYADAEGPWPFFYPYKGGDRWGIPILGEPDWHIAPENRPYVRSLYEGEVAYIDEAVGQLMGCLDGLGLRENTIVCFTSDHGEELWEHGRWGHGQSLHDELVRVPLILAGPGIAPREIAEPVSAIDLVPTLADLAGLPASSDWRGESLGPVLRHKDTAHPERPIFAQATSDKARPNPYQLVRLGRYKLIREAGSGVLSLYDLASDPKEQRDVAADNPEVTERLEKRLLDWLASFDSTFSVDDTAQDPGELFENLRGMGYL